MTESQKFKLEIGGRELTAEINNLAEQANGSVFLQYGETMVLATVVMSDQERAGVSFFPLTVDYEERFYAAGKIKGARYIKREAKPSDEAICNARLIDRAIRPLFPKDLKKEIQVIVTVLSWDGQNEPDVLSLLATSLALSISNIPWKGPVAAVRVGKTEKQFLLNPIYEEREKGEIDIVFAATEREDVIINMIEGNCSEAKEASILEGYRFAKPYLKKLLDFQEEIIKKIGREKISILPPQVELELEEIIKDFLGNKNKLEGAIYQKGKGSIEELSDELAKLVEEQFPGKASYARNFFEREVDRILHHNVMESGKRPDGRKLDEIREIDCKVSVLPRTHGSGLFCRGLTKTISILTLGAPTDVQLLEGMEVVGKKRFMHHYNFPPYCSGEIKPVRGPGRREIGHGILVEKALLPLIPGFEEFPYTIRIVSEILSSNGSSSMASVSSSSLALMDAGVPVKAPAAGISLGLVKGRVGDYKILTDIQGPEDYHGDMDFKVAGTKNGVTALQMDVKIDGITEEILKDALEKGKEAKFKILEKMSEVIAKPRSELSPFAPRILALQINPEKIREVIGPGGRVINEIIKECKVLIDVEESGKIFVTAEKEEAAKKAVSWIENITREIMVGEIFQGKVRRILSFGAIMEILPGQEGLLHISELAHYRVDKVEDIVKVGDIIPVQVISIDEQGRINLSLKALKKRDGKRN